MTTLRADREPLTGADDLPSGMESLPRGNLLLPYQQRIVAARNQPGLLFVEKSRRIGLTWGFAAYSVLRAARSKPAGGRKQLYISYAMDMTREFIDACGMWAKAFGLAASRPSELLFDDQDPATGDTSKIKAFRIDFASGFAIQALSSAPRSIRGKQGDVIIDEGAFVDNLGELLKAALALKMWGGDATVISTHDGVDNEFNQEIQKIRRGDRLGRVETITFDDAIADGLYERVCLTKGETPTAEGRAKYVAEVRGQYGSAASEELDVIPSRGGGAWLAHDEIERAERTAPVPRWELEDDFAKKPDEVRQALVRAWCLEHLAPLLNALDPRAPHGIGVDLARYMDLSDFWVLEERQDRSWATPFLIELRNMPYTEQRQVLRFMMDRIRMWSACIDKGGGGQDTAEQMQQAYGELRVRLVDMNSQFWLAEGPHVKGRFQDGRIEVPRDRDVAADLRGLQVVGGTPMVPKDRTRAKGEDSKKGEKRHYDAAVAMVLASAALRTGAAAPFDAVLAQDRPQGLFEARSEGFGSPFEDDRWSAPSSLVGGPNW